MLSPPTMATSLPFTSLLVLLLPLLTGFMPLAFVSSSLFAASLDIEGVEDCIPAVLLQLAPCAPFVQGNIPSPARTCCDSLMVFTTQQPNCLCMLLNDTNSFPINRTLALQLPLLCSLSSNTFTCPGVFQVPPTSPGLQTPPRSKPTSSTAAPPRSASPPLTVMHNSGSMQPNTAGGTFVAIAAVAISLMQVFN